MIRDIGINDFFLLWQGLKWTVALSVVAFAGGGIFGLAIALCRTARSRALSWAAATYIEVFQGTPLLLQLFVVYYGVALLNLDISAWAAAAIGLTLHASAYLAEIWRGCIQAVPLGQHEAAKALGLSTVYRSLDVILPQALKISLPPTVGFLVGLIKGTSLTAIIGFTELTRAGQVISNNTFQPLLIFAIVGALYFCLCWPLSLWSDRLEHKTTYA
jgi:polar amino acid transport system permease protein